ncbi:MAG: Clp protease ClpP [Alphaproteobacteria bacterium]|uniref:ATP-dependent Clp protease proteolytic subunit n=1 Tax=Candidatus Nitrobium versatile TaxID=2884831 RepID=A0A953JDZ1_9BACT|nr:Clp protease ClpP [Candidatus Nitrobium versatile]
MHYYTIRNRADGRSAEILLYGQIGTGPLSEGTGAKQFAQDLKALGNIESLTVRINSPGGSVFEGTAIYSQLRTHKARKTVYVDGIAASIASLIAMAGDKVVMPGNSMMMIHDPSALTVGTSGDMRKMAEALDKIKVAMMEAYREKTKLSTSELSHLMSEETWMTAEEAKQKGFCDEVTAPVQVTACYGKACALQYRNAPQKLHRAAFAETGGTDPRTLFDIEIDRLMCTGLSEGEAVRRVVRENPKAHEQYLSFLKSASAKDPIRWKAYQHYLSTTRNELKRRTVWI